MYDPKAPLRRLAAASIRLALAAVFCAAGVSPALASIVVTPPPPPPAASCDSSSSDTGCPASSSGGFNQAVTSAGSFQVGSTLGNAIGSFGAQLGGGIATGAGGARYALGDTGKSAAGGGDKWNAWFALSENHIAYTFQPLQSGGHLDVALAGLDYTFGNNLIVGAALSGERTRISTAFNGGSFRGNGNTFAPYLAWAITPRWILDAVVGVGTTDISTTDNTPGGGNGNTRDRRNLASLGLSYNYLISKWQLTGKGQVMSAQDRLGQFTLSNGTNVAASSNRITQLRFGGQAAYKLQQGITPFFGATYIYDAQRQNQAPLAGQNAANDRDAVQLQLGINFQSSGRLYGGLMLSTEQGRSQIKNDQVLANIGLRF
ncbi:MAG TPA: autotransporter outer membrane beta-barrel domain-containing protein [Burkholderiales bacterium]|jgi:hypothetical protein|nr:autotransporter outer membrane beta-barrel domain-containing protein [Burkholderiales bacterium]